MSRAAYLAVACAATLIVFASVVAIAGALLGGARLDATQDRLYTLSPATRSVLARLDEPVTLELYVSAAVADRSPLARAYAARVRQLLRGYAAAAPGRVRLSELDPAPFSAAEDRAIAAGLDGAPLEAGGDPLYLGLVGRNAVDEEIVLPFLAPEREATLEYEVTRLITELERPTRRRVALISSLDALTDGTSHLARELARSFDVGVLPADFDALPEGLDVVMIAHPAPLSPWRQYLIDQHLVAGGRALILLDPAALAARTPGAAGPDSSIDRLGPVLDRLGVAFREGVAIDEAGALPVERRENGRATVTPQPLYWSAGPSGLSQTDLITHAFRRGVHLAAPGALVARGGGLRFEPLIRSSTRAALIPAAQAAEDPDPRALADLPGDGTNYVVAARLSGPMATAFPDAAPPAPVRSAEEEALYGPLRPPPRRTSPAGPAEAILIADADLTADALYLGADGAPVADNAALIVNALELLTGDTALADLRARAPALRPLRRVEEARARAQERFAREQQGLEARLTAAQERLAALEAASAGAAPLAPAGAALSPQERRELERFRADAAAIRSRLRAIEAAYRAEVDRLEGLAVALNVWGPAALTALAGLVAAWRARRARAGR